MSDNRKIAALTIEFYVDGDEDYEAKADKLFEYAEEVMDCPDCEEDHECADDCEHRCNMLGMSGRLMTTEEFDREFLL